MSTYKNGLDFETGDARHQLRGFEKVYYSHKRLSRESRAGLQASPQWLQQKEQVLLFFIMSMAMCDLRDKEVKT